MKIHGTTIVAVRMGGKAAIGGDGQVTLGNTVVKHNANKIRRLGNNDVLAGFAGSIGDALTLFERFEEKLEKHSGNIRRASVELAKDWRSDRVLRRLEAMLAVINREAAFMISGTGDVIEPEDSVLALGSGGPYALAAARAFINAGYNDPQQVVRESLNIAGGICLYTNQNISVESL